MPVRVTAKECDPVVVHPPDPRCRRPRDRLHRRVGLLQDELRPAVDARGLRPALVQLVHVDLVVDVHELQQMEQEQRHVAVGDRRDVRDGARSGHAGVQLPQIHLARDGVGEEIQLEVAAVALGAQSLAHRKRAVPREVALTLAEHARGHVVAAPSAVVRGQLGKARELGHERPHEGAVARHDALDGRLARLDPLHHLQLLARELLLAVDPIGLRGDEERRLPGIPVRGLHDEVRPESDRRREIEELPVVLGPPEDIRHARHARLVPQFRRHDLRVQPVTKRRRRKRDLESELPRQALGLLVEHEERRLAAPLGRDVVDDLLVPEQVVADVLDRLEGPGRPLPRHEHVGVVAVERVVVVDESEVSDPAIDPEEVERRGRDEIHGRLVRPEEPPDLVDAPQTGAGLHAPPPRDVQRRIAPLRVRSSPSHETGRRTAPRPATRC